MIHVNDLPFEFVDAARAEKLLEKNTANRSVRLGTVDAYVHEILAGRWKKTPIPIILTEDKVAIDGQHRLMAIVKASQIAAKSKADPVVVPMFVVYGCDADMFDVVDQCSPRSTKDMARKMGRPNYYASIMRALEVYCRDKWGTANTAAPKMLNSRFAHVAKVFDSSVKFAADMISGTQRPTTSAVLAVVARAHHCGVDPSKLEAFVRILRNNEPEQRTDGEMTILAFYKWIMRLEIAGTSQALGITSRAERALFAYLHDERLAVIRPIRSNPWPVVVS